MTIADVLRPAGRQRLFYEIGLIVGGSILVSLFAKIAVPLPFSPVPITGQTLAVLLIGALFDSWRGALTMLAYLSEGMLGLPVFAGGSGGISHLLGPTGGYLFGFVAAAFVTGMLSEKGWDRKAKTTFLAMLIGDMAIYIFGLSWLSYFIGYRKILEVGLYPFIPGDILKICLATALLPSAWKKLDKFGMLK